MTNTARRTAFLAVAVSLALLAPPAAFGDLDQGMSYFKSGKYAEAAAEFQTLVDQSPAYDYGYYMLGNCFIKMQKLSDAETNFRKALELNPDKFEYHYGLANVLRSERKYSAAVDTLNKAEGLATSGAHKYALYSQRGFSNAALKKWEEAVPDLEEALKIKRDPTVLDQLGKAYYVINHNDKAATVLRESAKLDPNDADTQEVLTKVLLNLGAETSNDSKKKEYYLEALRTADRLQKLRPSEYEAIDLRGQAALGAGDMKAAEEAFERVLSMRSDYCFAMINLSKVHIAREEWKDAEKHLIDAAACAPRMAVVHMNLGFVYEKQGRLEEAVAAYKKSNELQSSDAARASIARVQQNIQIRAENAEMAAQEAAALAAAEAEKQRIKEFEEKVEEYKKKTDQN